MVIKRIALYGGSFNPPHIWHRQIVEWLAREFDEVFVIPCGRRRDKEITNDMAPRHRAAMCHLAFDGLSNVCLDFADLESGMFTSNYELQRRYGGPDIELWHVIGTDLWRDGQSVILKSWQHGQEIWDSFNWLIVSRPELELPKGAELPPHHRLETVCSTAGSSSDIRDRLIKHQPVADRLPSAVLAYIQRYGLYLGRPASAVTQLSLADLRPFLHVDSYNARAQAFAQRLSGLMVQPNESNAIIVCGGDGTMLRAVFRHWQRRLPFIGLNFGQAGFLMNGLGKGGEHEVEQLLECLRQTQFTCYQLPLLSVIWEDDQVVRHCSHAFNDVYVKNESPTVAIRMDVVVYNRNSDRQWFYRGVMGDGLICANEAGSTGYAYQAGAEPLSLSAEGKWLFKGICARRIPQMNLDTDFSVNVDLGTNSYRKAVLCADDRVLGPVTRFTVSMSNIAAVELCFLPGTDLTAKRIDLVTGR